MQMDWVRRCSRGDEDAYRELLQKYEKPLINFIFQYVARRHTAEDLFQETWIRVIRSIDRYRPTASLTTWIFTIARNLCLDYLKYQRRHKTVPLQEGSRPDDSMENGHIVYFKDPLPAGGQTPHEHLEQSEARELMNRALAQLSPQKREAVILRVTMGFTYDEVAEIVGAPVGTVKYRVHDALNDLAKKLGRRQVDFGGQADAV